MARPVVVDLNRSMHRRWGMGDLAALLNRATKTDEWDSQKILRVLKRHNAVKEERAVGATKGRYYTTLRDVRRAFPELWEELQLGCAVIDDP